MKKIVVITLACILVLSSFLFTACDERVDNNKPSEQTTAMTKSNPDSLKPIPVPAVKGKNARQLFEDAISDYTNSKSFDLSMTMETTELGVKKIQKVEVKLNENSMYMDIDLEEQAMKMWFVDNVLYAEMDDEKYKFSNAGVDDVLGENFIDELLSELPTNISEIPEAYMKKMESAQIYSYKGTYYFSVTITDAEAIEMEFGEKGYTETMYFDSTGAIKKIIDKTSEETLTLLINSYGKDFKISKPKNADEFIETPTNSSPDTTPVNPNIY